MKQWWKCPNCNKVVDFATQMQELFDEDDGEAIFDEEKGVYFHTITCECGAYWVTGISNVHYHVCNRAKEQ